MYSRVGLSISCVGLCIAVEGYVQLRRTQYV